MKLAIILRGISYWDEEKSVSLSKTIDYRLCLESMLRNLIEPLKTVYDEIDFFIITYNNPKILELFSDFSPKDILIYPKSWINKFRNVITTKLLLDSIDMIEEYDYDNILITRFDLVYYKPLDMSKVKREMFNFGWVGEAGQADDNWLLFSHKHIPVLRKHLNNNNSPSAHYINNAFSNNERNYVCQLDPVNGRHMPTFYYMYRYKDDIESGKIKLFD